MVVVPTESDEYEKAMVVWSVPAKTARTFRSTWQFSSSRLLLLSSHFTPRGRREKTSTVRQLSCGWIWREMVECYPHARGPAHAGVQDEDTSTEDEHWSLTHSRWDETTVSVGDGRQRYRNGKFGQKVASVDVHWEKRKLLLCSPAIPQTIPYPKRWHYPKAVFPSGFFGNVLFCTP